MKHPGMVIVTRKTLAPNFGRLVLAFIETRFLTTECSFAACFEIRFYTMYALLRRSKLVFSQMLIIFSQKVGQFVPKSENLPNV